MPTPLEAATHAQSRQAVVLALVAGYVDAVALQHYRVFVSFMSGNTTQAGLNAGQANWTAAGLNLLPIPAFVMGIMLGTLLGDSRLRRPVGRLCGVAAALLLIGSALAGFHAVPPWCGIVVLAFAMGVLNTTITIVGGQPVSLGFVTGDLNNLGRHLAFRLRRTPMSDSRGPWDTRERRAWTLAGVWCSFFFGALLGGAAVLGLGNGELLPPAMVLGVVALCDRGRHDLSGLPAAGAVRE